MVKTSARLAAAKVVAQRKALMVLKQRYQSEIMKIEKQLERPANVQLEVPKEIVKIDVEAPKVNVDAPQVNVTVPEKAIQVLVESEAPTVNAPVHVTIPENAIQVHVHVKADAPILPPLTPPAITFSPKMPEVTSSSSPSPRRTEYDLIRHEHTGEVLKVVARDK